MDRELLERARWIVEHGADKRRAPGAEVGIPLYIEEYPARPEDRREREVEYTIEF